MVRFPDPQALAFWNRLNGVRLAVVADVDTERALTVAAEHGQRVCAVNVDELLAAPPDVVLNLTLRPPKPKSRRQRWLPGNRCTGRSR
jgi:hypothetical protein